MAGATNGAGWKAARVVEMHEREGGYVGREERSGIPEMNSYISFSEISEERVLMT